MLALVFCILAILHLYKQVRELKGALQLEREECQLLELQMALELQKVGECFQLWAATGEAYTEFLKTLGADNAEARHHLETWLEEHR